MTAETHQTIMEQALELATQLRDWGIRPSSIKTDPESAWRTIAGWFHTSPTEYSVEVRAMVLWLLTEFPAEGLRL